MRLFFVAAVLFITKPVFACDKLLEIIRSAYPRAVFSVDDKDKGFDLSGEQSLHVNLTNGVECKPWPEHPELTLAAVTLEHRPIKDEQTDADLEIIVVDTITSAIRSRLVEADIMTSDAERAFFRGFDMARYELAPKVTAFGIRIGYSGGTYHTNNYSEDLRLYRISGDTITSVSGPLSVNSSNTQYYYFRTKNPVIYNCGESQEKKTTIGVGATAHNGFYDLKLLEATTIGKCRTRHDSDGEQWVKQTRVTRYRLQYNGKHYSTSADFQ